VRLILLLLLAMASVANAAVVLSTNHTVQLAWNKHVDPNVYGYRVYWGTASHTYTANVNIEGINSTVITISNLTANVVYYFAATAHYANGAESGFSDEINYTPLYIPPPTPQQRITFQMQVSTHPETNFIDLPGATITITNAYNALVPGYFYKTLIDETPIP